MHEQNAANADLVRAHVARITSSELFAGAERLCRFLTFTIESTLNGRAADIKEYTLGREVFDRGDGYDPRIDPIVRVEARRLRARLAEYYGGPGRNEPLRIEYPKGSYLPHIRTATRAAVPTGPRARAGSWIAGAATVCVALAIALALLRSAPMRAPIPESWIQANDGTLDARDVALAEEIDAALANDASQHVVAWPAIAQLRLSHLDLADFAARLRAQELVVVLVRDEASARRISVFVVDEPQGRKRLALTYYADASLAESAVRDQYAKRIARDLSN